MVDLISPAAVPIADSVPPSRSGMRDAMRKTLTAIVSALVVLAAAVYVFAPDGANVQLSVAELHGPQPYDHEATPRYSLAAARVPLSSDARRCGCHETIYGSVDAKGVPVSQVRLSIIGNERATRGQAAYAYLAGTGVYRVHVHLRPGRYKIAMRLKVRNQTKLVATVKTLRYGRYYSVRVKVRPNGAVTFLPVTTY